MAQRLFNGSIQPQARPLNSFVQPGQRSIAGPTQQSQVQIGRGIVTQQQAGTSSVAGFNQWEQLTTALKPFSKQLDNVVKKGFRQYAINNIEEGYYDELKNEQLRAKLQMQQNQEAGAADAAETITAIQKVDPVGAALAKEANPWKLIGRKRALAQLAAGEVAARFNFELATNAGELSTMAPGSAALMQRKAELTQGVLSDFGLSGDELESAYYVSPQINKSWDKFTQKQSELYSAEVYRSQTALTGAAVKTQLDSMLVEGVLLPTGERIMPGDPSFGDAAGVLLTREIDKGVSLLGGDDKTKALKSIRQNLGLLRNVPGASSAIDNIRLGSAYDPRTGKPVPMKDRPRWIDANPYELQDYSNKALQLQSAAYEARQQTLKDGAEQRWNQVMSGLQVDSPEYQEALKGFEAELEAAGYRDTAGFIRERISDDQAVAEGNGGLNPISFEDRAVFEEALGNLTPETVSAGYRLAREAASREPTEEARLKAYSDYVSIIKKREAQFAGLPKNSAMRSAVNNLVKEDLAQEGIAGLKGNTTWQSGAWGSARPGAAVTASEGRYRTFGNEVRTLHTKEYWKQLTAWRNANPGATVDPSTEAQILADSAAAVRQSEAFKAAKNRALLKGDSTPPPPVNQDPKTGPVPQAAASSVTPAQASSYVDKPVMNARWVRSELNSIREGTVAGSSELQGLAKAAGVPPHRYLLEQLKFYGPTLDPTGAYRGWLEKSLQQEKSNSTPAVTYGDQSSASRAPGAWLNAMVMPIQIAS